MPIAIKKSELISVEDYLAGELVSEIKYEYLGGYVYAMAGGSNEHNRIAVGFMLSMGAQLRGKPCEPFNSDTKVRVQRSNHIRFYYPDGMVVCEPNPGSDSFQDKPVILAEVISKSTRRVDETEKLEAYLDIPSLQVYLLIETDIPRVTVYRRSDNNFEQEIYDGLDAVISLDCIDSKLALSELYERVELGNG